jgi:integrase
VKITLRDGSGTIELRHVIEDMDRHGNVRIYVRRKGQQKIRLRSEPGTEAFLREYREALAKPQSAQSRATPTGSLRWLVEQYLASGEFKTLAQSTQIQRRRILDALCLEPISEQDSTPIASLPFASMPSAKVRLLRDRKAALPEAANHRVRTLRRVFSWALENGLAEHNPAREIRRFRTGSQGFHTWTVEEVAQYEEKHPIGTKPRLALALLLFAGPRRSDVVRLGRQNVRNGLLTYTPIKTRKSVGKPITVPILPALQEIIDATPSGHMTFLATAYGRPFTAAGFGMRMRGWCDAAGLPHCSAHGLRKAGATIAAERGATPHQLMAIYGWQSIAEAERYTKAARQKLLAAEAMHLLEPQESPTSEPVVSHQKLSG